MNDDMIKFLKSLWEEKAWSVAFGIDTTWKITSFGNDNRKKIMGKGIVNLVNGSGKDQNILFGEEIKNNLLNMSQLCD